MRRFEFKLENVLQLKQHMEHQKQQELAVHLNRLHEAESVLLKLQNQQQTSYQHRDTLVATGIAQRDIMMLDNHQRFLKRRVEHQHQQITIVQQDVEKKQAELVDAVKEKEIYENHRRRKWDEYKQAVLAEEQLFLDEIAVRNYHFQNTMKANS